MINGINNENNDRLLNSRLGGESGVSQVVTNPIENSRPLSKENKYNFIDESAISIDAYKIYEHEMDIKKFTKAMNSLDEDSCNKRVQELFDKGVVNPFIVDDFETISTSLSKNKDFLRDIEFETL